MGIERSRACRRCVTETVAQRRHSSYVTILLNGDPSGHRRAETSPHYWAKQGIYSCGCGKRRKNRPRISKGMCDIGARNRVYRLRAMTRELAHLVLRVEDLESDAVALLSGVLVNDLW